MSDTVIDLQDLQEYKLTEQAKTQIEEADIPKAPARAIRNVSVDNNNSAEIQLVLHFQGTEAVLPVGGRIVNEDQQPRDLWVLTRGVSPCPRCGQSAVDHGCPKQYPPNAGDLFRIGVRTKEPNVLKLGPTWFRLSEDFELGLLEVKITGNSTDPQISGA